MKTTSLVFGLSAVVLLQLMVLVAEYVNAVYPIWTGQEIMLKTVPVDPRSMFRGNYARLKYEISNIPGASINSGKNPRNGERVFVTLKKGSDGLYSYQGVSLEKPEEGLFIRGRVDRRPSKHKLKKYQVKYGIEAFFAPKEKALSLENKLRENGVAVIMLSGNGKATLKDVRAKK